MIMKGVREVYDAWIREEMDRKMNSRQVAGERVVEFAVAHNWSTQELQDVLAMLGIIGQE